MHKDESLRDAAWSFLRPPQEVAEELLRHSEPPEVLPAHLLAAKRRAAQLGIDLDSVLSQDEERLNRALFPTADCLTPAEVEWYWTEEDDFPNSRRAHLETCKFCIGVLDAARPSEEQLQRFLDELGSLPALASLKRRRRTSSAGS